MHTKKIKVSSDGCGMVKALDEVENFGHAMGFAPRDALRCRLLAEETLGMVKAIVEDFTAAFWVESRKGISFELHLRGEADMNLRKKQDLIEASTRQRNEAAVGFMGKILDFIEDSLLTIADDAAISATYTNSMGSMLIEDNVYLWSLEKYRRDVQGVKEGRADLLDELEKSLVARIADDVKVSVTGSRIEMTISKNFPVQVSVREEDLT
jgi:hypothetical protein